MWRYLAGNKSCEGPRHVFTVDTETTRTDHPTDQSASIEKLRLGVARYCRFERGKATNQVAFAFNTTEQFWAWLAQRAAGRSVNWIFAHSAGFDMRALGFGQEVDKGRLTLTRPPRRTQGKAPGKTSERQRTGLLVLESPPTIVDCWFPGGNQIRWVDSRNWWNCPLAEIGRQLGLEKLPMPDPWDADEAWLTYCARDCEILERAVVELLGWHREHDLGVFKPTAAGQSLQAFRHRFHSKKIVLHDEPGIKQLERKSYYAGRLACFYLGIVKADAPGWSSNPLSAYHPQAPKPCGVVYRLDVNSLFPSVMRQHLFPRRLVAWKESCNESPDILPDAGAKSVACVLLNSPSTSYPVRNQSKVSFCCGSMMTTLAGPELSQAIKAGHCQRVLAFANYDLEDLFSSYVDFFYQLRYMAKLAGRTVEATLCKLMLNSLYGKFGQHNYEWVSLPGRLAPDDWSCWYECDRSAGKIRQFRSIGGLVQERQDRGDHPDSFVAISSFVTSYARVRMDQLRAIAGHHNVYYQGVDSLYVSALGLKRLRLAGEVDDTALGKLRLEGESRETHFRGHGYYCFNGQWVRMSIRRGAKEIAIGTWQQDQFESLERSLSKPPIDGVAVRQVQRTIDPEAHDLETTAQGWVIPKRAAECELQQLPFDVRLSCVL